MNSRLNQTGPECKQGRKALSAKCFCLSAKKSSQKERPNKSDRSGVTLAHRILRRRHAQLTAEHVTEAAGGIPQRASDGADRHALNDLRHRRRQLHLPPPLSEAHAQTALKQPRQRPHTGTSVFGVLFE